MTTPLRDGLLYFNPRSHEGSDEDGSSLTAVTIGISIHAPTRGATVSAGISLSERRFQSTLPQGERLMAEVKDAGLKLFQSTLPQGERLLWIALNVNKKIHFNPRSHKGSDRKITSLVDAFFLFQSTLPQGERHWVCRQCITYVTISIHAPTRGATISMMAFRASMRNFNPRSHKGSDRDRGGIAAVHDISIHAPTRGATAKSQVTARTMENFNPRSHKGSDLFSCFERVDYTYFNPRSHKGSDERRCFYAP